MYKINDYLVYQKDVCIVSNIEEKNNITYYILHPLRDKSLKITLPTTSDKIRDLITKEEIDNLIKISKDIPLIECDEKYIEAEYKRLLQDPTYENIIKVIKTSYTRNKLRQEQNKKPSEKDTKYFNLAEEFLYNELSITLNLSYEETKEFFINQISNQ